MDKIMTVPRRNDSVGLQWTFQ